jgi:hypothetical protein
VSLHGLESLLYGDFGVANAAGKGTEGYGVTRTNGAVLVPVGADGEIVGYLVNEFGCNPDDIKSIETDDGDKITVGGKITAYLEER